MNLIVVHGVHRSGTSFIASLLEKSGLWWADKEDQMLPQEDNPKGFWERSDVVQLNDKMLRFLGLSWFTLVPEVTSDQIDRLFQEFRDEIFLILRKFPKNQICFIKDPRLSLTWPVWDRCIDGAHHLFVFRDPSSVSTSLWKRNKIDRYQSTLFWYHQNRMICKHIYAYGLDFISQIEFERKLNPNAIFTQVNKLCERIGHKSKLKIGDIANQFDETLLKPKKPNAGVQAIKLGGVKPEKVLELMRSGSISELAAAPECKLNCVESDWLKFDSRIGASLLARNIEETREHLVRAEQNYSELEEVLVINQKNHSEDQKKLAHYINAYNDLNALNEQGQVQYLGLQRQYDGLNEQYQDLKERFQEMRLQRDELQSENQQLDEERRVAKQDQALINQQYEGICRRVENREERLLVIASELKKIMYQRRYVSKRFLAKLLSILGFNYETKTQKLFNIAVYDFSNDVTESYLPKPPIYYSLGKAVSNNYRAFISKITVSRLIKAAKVVLGLTRHDLKIEQALKGYVSEDTRSSSLDLVNPNEIELSYQMLEFPEVADPQVSIVIPVFENLAVTIACLIAIKNYTENSKYSYQVLIADDCSQDETEKICDYVTGLKVIRQKVNQGFLKNCNYAIPEAEGEYIVLLNNDTNVQEGWLPPLIEALRGDSSIAITGPMFLYPDGRLQESGGIIFQGGDGWNYGRFDAPNKPEFLFDRDVDYVSGACLVFRKQFWIESGGFDERFAPAYYEDTDLCFTARTLGHRVRYLADSRVVHYEGVSHGSDTDSGVKKYQLSNKFKFVDKWKNELEEDHYVGPESLFLARIHGRTKKVILFIDHYVPHYDQDAGSRLALRYIKLMLELDCHVIFLGNNFYCHEPYTHELQKLGVEVLYGESYKNSWKDWLYDNCDSIDSIYLNRPHISEQYIDYILSLPEVPHIAYHGSDLHYLRVQREEELGIKSSDSKTASQWKEIEFSLMRKCDVSLWLSQVELETILLEDENLRVEYMPMDWVDEVPEPTKRNKIVSKPKVLFVGGFGHPPNVDGLNWFLNEIFPNVVKECPNVVFEVIGSKCPDDVKELSDNNINIRGEVSDEELFDAYLEARLCVVPLRYGAGVKGKVMESMKMSVPVITTSIGAEGLVGDVSEYLEIQDDVSNFTNALVNLLSDDNRVAELQENATNALREYYSKDKAIRAVSFITGVNS